MAYKNIEDKKEYFRKYYLKNSSLIKSRSRKNNVEHKKRIRKWIEDFKIKNPCPCGESDPICLDFHHEKGDKEITVSRAVSWGWSLRKLRKEIAKCLILCSNCHRKEHRRLRHIADVANR